MPETAVRDNQTGGIMAGSQTEVIHLQTGNPQEIMVAGAITATRASLAGTTIPITIEGITLISLTEIMQLIPEEAIMVAREEATTPQMASLLAVMEEEATISILDRQSAPEPQLIRLVL